MPTYVYKCQECGNERYASHTVQDCDKAERELMCVNCCKTGTSKRVPQPVGIAFKGAGFYCTDHPKGK